MDSLDTSLVSAISLLNPISDRWINSSQIQQLYQEDQLTQEEYILLEYLGCIEEIKGGLITISFQGLKRKFDLHQARLTKALKRLMEKSLLEKTKNGYTLTEEGSLLANSLMKKFGRKSTIEKEIHSYVASGEIRGKRVTKSDHEIISNAISGKWWGDFRFIAKAENKDGSYEVEWISTNGIYSAKLVIGPKNKVSIVISSSRIIFSEVELQLMMERISTLLEREIDATVTFTSRSVYEIHENRIRSSESDIVPSKFAS